MKKKYNLPLGSGKGSGEGSTKKASDAAGPNQPAVPATPSKQRVSKAKATPTPKKKATLKPKKAKKEVKEDELEDADELAVRSPDVSDNEAAFGKKEDSEEEASGAEA